MRLSDAQRAALKALYLPGVLIVGASLVLLALVKTNSMPAGAYEYTLTGANVMFYSLFLAIIVCYATLPLRPIELALVAGIGLLLEMAVWAQHPSYTFTQHLHDVGSRGGIVAFVGIVWRTIFSRGDERLWAGGMFIISLIMFLFPSVSMWLHFMVELHTPMLYDAFAYKVDGGFGLQPAAIMTGLVAQHDWLYNLTFVTYNELPLFMVIGVVLSLKWPERCYGKVMLHFLTIGLVGFICYWIFPMKGVSLFAPDFPDILPTVDIPIPFEDSTFATRNCYPSLHLGWMLAIYFGVRGVHPWVQRIGLFFVLSMIAATLYPGVHYVVDQVAALPYVVGFYGLINRATDENRRARWLAAIVGFALFAVFSLLIFGAPVALAARPTMLATLVVGVIAASLYVEHQLFVTTVQSEIPRHGKMDSARWRALRESVPEVNQAHA